MSYWTALKIGASSLSAQRLRLDLIANNVANAESTSTEEGGPYQRQDVVFEANQSNRTFASFLPINSDLTRSSKDLEGVTVKEIITDDTQGTTVYDPTHPDADEEGMVTYPNVNLVVEMTNMLSATRSYEASLSVIDAARSMALSALEIGS